MSSTTPLYFLQLLTLATGNPHAPAALAWWQDDERPTDEATVIAVEHVADLLIASGFRHAARELLAHLAMETGDHGYLGVA